MAENNYLLIVGMLTVILLTAGFTYYISAAIMQPTCQNQTGEAPQITVRGEATKTFAPDSLNIGITLESFGNDAPTSQAKNSNDTALFKAALLAAGLNSSEIQTSSYYISPVYNNSCYDCYSYGAMPEGGTYQIGAGGATTGYSVDATITPPMPPCKNDANCTIIGYKTVHAITIKTDRTADGAKFVEAAVNATNATKIDYVYFSVKGQTRLKVQSELQASAASNAKTKAQDIASGLGASLGKIVSVNSEYYYPYPIYSYQKGESTGSDAGAAATPPTEIFPTDTTMSSSIVVVYGLEQ